MQYNPDDRKIIENLISRSRTFKVNGRRYQIPALTFGQYIDLYLGLQYIDRARDQAVKKPKLKLTINSIVGFARRMKVIRRNYFYGRRLVASAIGKVREKDFIKILILVKNYYFNPFHRPRASGESSIYDNTYEVWVYNVIDVIASNYGWTISEILNTKYRVILELMASINNRKVSDVMDSIMSSVSGHVGSRDVIQIAKARIMKRKDVFIPIDIMRAADSAAMKSLIKGGLN